MKRLLFGLIIALPLLSGCLRRSDALAPIVTITSPPSGAVQTADSLLVRGFALDDEGVAAIRVDGSDLLEAQVFQNERGKRLVEFGFDAVDISEGEQVFVIEVEDVTGRVTTHRYAVQIDTTPPDITLESVERLNADQLRVSGVVTDDNGIRSIRINDQELPFPTTTERPFSLTIPSAATVTITATDQAGNERTIQQDAP